MKNHRATIWYVCMCYFIFLCIIIYFSYFCIFICIFKLSGNRQMKTLADTQCMHHI